MNYKDFHTFLTKEKLEKCLPGIDTIVDGLTVYHKYFSKEKETEYGIVAIRIMVLKS
jgi:ASC-1-like (ASCH) protein